MNRILFTIGAGLLACLSAVAYAGFFLACLSTVAYAGEGEDGEKAAAPETPSRWEQLQSRYDLDKDGKITWTEYQKVNSGFTTLDQDGDGVISKDDAEKLPEAPGLEQLQALLKQFGGGSPFGGMVAIPGMGGGNPFGGMGGFPGMGGGNSFGGMGGFPGRCGGNPFGGMGGCPGMGGGNPFGGMGGFPGRCGGNPFGQVQGGPDMAKFLDGLRKQVESAKKDGAATPNPFDLGSALEGGAPAFFGSKPEGIAVAIASQQADESKDGTLTKAEWSAWLKTLDADEKGAVSKEKLATLLPEQARSFGSMLLTPMFDHDADGTIEISDLEAAWKAADKDGDGSVVIKDLAPKGAMAVPFGK